MHETDADLEAVQRLLDDSCASGEHLRRIPRNRNPPQGEVGAEPPVGGRTTVRNVTEYRRLLVVGMECCHDHRAGPLST